MLPDWSARSYKIRNRPRAADNGRSQKSEPAEKMTTQQRLHGCPFSSPFSVPFCDVVEICSQPKPTPPATGRRWWSWLVNATERINTVATVIIGFHMTVGLVGSGAVRWVADVSATPRQWKCVGNETSSRTRERERERRNRTFSIVIEWLESALCGHRNDFLDGDNDPNLLANGRPIGWRSTSLSARFYCFVCFGRRFLRSDRERPIFPTDGLYRSSSRPSSPSRVALVSLPLRFSSIVSIFAL